MMALKKSLRREIEIDKYINDYFFILFVGEGMVEPTALHRVKCQELGCTYQMLAISDLR
jgi:hypothetical protein